MIASLTGQLRAVEEDRIHLQTGPIVYELLIPSSDLNILQAGVGEEMTFHTLMYLQGDASGGNIEPRLIGFLRPQDKKFFEKFITVKGIGPRKALKALALPVGEIAQAIEAKECAVPLPAPGDRQANGRADRRGTVGEGEEFRDAVHGGSRRRHGKHASNACGGRCNPGADGTG